MTCLLLLSGYTGRTEKHHSEHMVHRTRPGRGEVAEERPLRTRFKRHQKLSDEEMNDDTLTHIF